MIKIDIEMPGNCNNCFSECFATCRIFNFATNRRLDVGGYTSRRHPKCPLIEEPAEKTCHNCKHEADLRNRVCQECEPVRGTNWEWEEAE